MRAIGSLFINVIFSINKIISININIFVYNKIKG